VPLTAFLNAMIHRTDPVPFLRSWQLLPDWWSWWHTGVVCLLYFLPIVIDTIILRRALDIYDAIFPPVQGTHERPRVREDGPTAHASANGGSRRRHRAE
jgi:hypothetical protein